MPALMLGTLDVKVMDKSFRRLPNETSGIPQRTLNGQLRGDLDWTRRAWGLSALGNTEVEANALAALVGTNVVASGDLLQGQSVTVRVETEGEEWVGYAQGWYRLIGLRLREV